NRLRCGDVCVDGASDPANCGACGNACPSVAHATATCSDTAGASTCGFACDAGYTACGGACVPTSSFESDPSNCGACGNVCASAANAATSCSAGACALTCATGFAECDGDPSNGCETSTTTAANCGSCGNVCPSVANATSTCSDVA